MADLDLAALRREAETMFGPSWMFDKKTMLSLLDRIEELERIIHFERHFCRWVDCGASTLEHYHCPDGCMFKSADSLPVETQVGPF